MKLVVTESVENFVNCEFRTGDDSTYYVYGLFLYHARLELEEPSDFMGYTTFERDYRTNKGKLFALCEEHFGPAIDEDRMVRWYWHDHRERLYLRSEADALILKLVW